MFDSIFDSCNKETSFIRRPRKSVVQCYTAEIERVSASIRRFDHSASCLREAEFYDIPEAEYNIKICNGHVVESAKEKIVEVRDTANFCIQNFGDPNTDFEEFI